MGKGRARVGLVLDDLEVDAAIGMLEADITLADARARFSGRDPVAVQMADPPFERPLGVRIGADSELVRSLASLVAGPAGRKGRRSEEHTSVLQSLMRIAKACCCVKK